MEATEDKATLEVDADTAEDTISLAQTVHPRKVSVNTQVTTSSIMEKSQRLIR